MLKSGHAETATPRRSSPSLRRWPTAWADWTGPPAPS